MHQIFWDMVLAENDKEWLFSLTGTKTKKPWKVLHFLRPERKSTVL
jgi:hypothetical protein